MSCKQQASGALGAYLIDMRRFAALSKGAIPGQDFLASRHFIDLSDANTSLGTIDLDASSGVVNGMAGDEFIIVLEGALTITADTEFTIQSGDSAVLPNNANFAWHAAGPSLLAFIRHSSQSQSLRSPFRNEPMAPRVEAPAQPAHLLIGPQPKAYWNLEYISEGGRFTAGSWDGSPFKRIDFLYDYFEMIHFIEGAVDFSDIDGAIYPFRAGDVIAVRRGAKLGWDSRVTVAKVAALCRQ